jgi:predicted metal-dependent hydrolase
MPERQILLSNQPINYFIRHSSRAKRIRLTIYPGGKLVITLPNKRAERYVERFLKEKADWIVTKVGVLKQQPQPTAYEKKKDYLAHKLKALELVKEKLKQLNEFYGFKYLNVSVRDQSTRWGSCSSAGNLSFNYRIAKLPDRLIDYIVVHELCHLKEMNHSSRFWSLVGQTIPDYQSIKRELKTKGLELS